MKTTRWIAFTCVFLAAAACCAVRAGDAEPPATQPAGPTSRPTLAAPAASTQPATAPAGIEARLAELAAGTGDWKQFSVTYDDRDPFHGGLALTIHGDGKVDQTVARRPPRDTRTVKQADLNRLVDLLVKLHAWEHKESDHVAAPEESRIRLTIRCGGQESKIWEWNKEAAQNDRIVQVQKLMVEIGLEPFVGRQ